MQRLYTKIKLEIVGANMVIENADVSVELEKSDDGSPNYCTVTVYNVSEATYTTLNDKANHVRVYAEVDDDQGYVLIFQGDLRDLIKWKKYKATTLTKKGKKRKRKPAKVQYESPPITREASENDIATVIQLQDGIKDTFLNNFYSKSYKGAVTNKKILSDLLDYIKQRTTIGIGNMATLTEKTFAKGYVVHDTISGALRTIARTGNCTSLIENNVLNIYSNNATSDVYGYYLHSGICPRPEFNANKEVSVLAPFLPTIQVGNFVKLDFQDIEGIYPVKKIETKIDNFGKDYETNLTLRVE